MYPATWGFWSDEASGRKFYYHVLSTALAAISPSSKPLHLDVEWDWRDHASPILFSPSPALLNDLQSHPLRTTHVRLWIQTAISGANDMAPFINIFAQAQCLELKSTDKRNEDIIYFTAGGGETSFNALAASMHIPGLVHLVLTGCEAAEDDIFALLARHGSLETVSFKDVRLETAGSWALLLQRLLELEKLRRVTIDRSPLVDGVCVVFLDQGFLVVFRVSKRLDHCDSQPDERHDSHAESRGQTTGRS
ncbi:hypothetical protein QBC34DRAFT_383475 [Podospora aff. communis PSN243]|uniref:Uncharacterized protein n=1 Tax=Podospora aff. communis PSN243 TaxID=3040156 RepID=A0AAV9GG21_9PEZI|nr:hypothetical protein QBC34DRAFT_383475 [Podospora aff. communis PSN243]